MIDLIKMNCFRTSEIVDTTWNGWSNWPSWTYWTSEHSGCDYRYRTRYRSCPGSNPKGTSKTTQHGGERDCDGSDSDSDWETLHCP